jgi:hypothetical protein
MEFVITVGIVLAYGFIIFALTRTPHEEEHFDAWVRRRERDK